MGTAKHRAIDRLRRSKLHERKEQELARELEIRQDANQPDLDAALDDEVGDDLLRLVFTTCHPVLSHRGAGGAHAPPARRPDHQGDRAGVPGPGGDGGAAHRPGQADALRGEGALRGPGR